MTTSSGDGPRASGMAGGSYVMVAAAAEPDPGGEGVTLREVLAIVRRRLPMLLGIVVTGSLLGAVVGLQQTPRYTAKATVIIEPNAGRVFDAEAVSAGLGQDLATVETQIRVIQSREMAERVMDELNLFQVAEFRPRIAERAERDVAWRIEEPWSSMVGWMPASWLIATGLAEERPDEPVEPAAGHVDADGLVMAQAGTGVASDALHGPAGQDGSAAGAAWRERDLTTTSDGVPHSEAEIRALARARVAESLNAIDPLREASIDRFARGLRTSQEGRSRAIAVTFTSTDPERAALIANRVAEMYVQMQLEAKLQATSKATGWLGDRLDELKRELERAEQAVQQYRIANDLADEGRTDLTDQRAVQTNQELLMAQSDLAQRQARLAFLREMRAKGENLDSLPEVVGNPLIMALRQQESDMLRQEGELLASFGAKHPRVVQLRADKAKLLGKIDAEIGRIVANLENEEKVAEARVATLEQSMRGVSQASGRSLEATVRLRELEREANASRALYENFLMRFKETREQQQIVEADSRIVSRAAAPDRPSTPGVPVFVLGGLVASSVLGLMGLVWLERNDEGLRNAKDVQRHLGLAQVGFVPSIKDLRRGMQPWRRLVEKPFSAYAESIRSVLAAIRFSDVDNPPKVILVTSSVPEEGKSTLASSLATLAAQGDKAVLLVDLDMRKPTQHKIFEIETRAGIVEHLAGDADLDEVVVRHELSGVDVVTVKRRPVNPTALIESERMAAFIHEAREHYHLVVLDMPPVLGVTDAQNMAPLADGVIFVTRWAETRRQLADSALELLRTARARLLGVVLTQVDVDKHRKYGYGDVGEYYGKYKKYYTD